MTETAKLRRDENVRELKDDVLLFDWALLARAWIVATRDGKWGDWTLDDLAAQYVKLKAEMERRGYKAEPREEIEQYLRQQRKSLWGRFVGWVQRKWPNGKQENIDPNEDLSEMGVATLLSHHELLHRWYAIWITEKGQEECTRMHSEPDLARILPEGWTREDIVNLHVLILQELHRRGVRFQDHGDQLDQDSKPFLKSPYAVIHPSGNEPRPEITMAQVLDPLSDSIVLCKGYMEIFGPALEGKAAEKIDVLVREPEAMAQEYKHVLMWRCMRAFPEVSKRSSLRFHFDPEMRLEKSLPIFDLVLERINPQNEVLEMALAADELEEGNATEVQVTLGEALESLRAFKLRREYVSLVGGVVIHGKTEGDADFLFKESPDMLPGFKARLEKALKDKFEAGMQERVEFHYDRFFGPFTDHVPLFDLLFHRVNQDNAVFDQEGKELARYDTAREAWLDKAMKPGFEATKEAEQTKRENKIAPGRAFHTLKPVKGSGPEEAQTVPNFLKWAGDEMGYPLVVQKKYDGVHVEFLKAGEKVRVVTEDGVEVTDRVPAIVKALQELPVRDLSLDGELEMWKGGRHQPREVTAGNLFEKGPADDSAMVANIWDVLFFKGWEGDKAPEVDAEAGDLHEATQETRLKYLAAIPFGQATTGAPDVKIKLNRAPSQTAKDQDALGKIVGELRYRPGSEGVVAKKVEGAFPLSGSARVSIKFHNSSTLRGIVYRRTPVKDSPGVYNYRYAISAGPVPVHERNVVEIAGRKFLKVGTTFNTSILAKIGDVLEIEVETLNRVRDARDGTIEISGWVPRVLKGIGSGPDTVAQAVQRARRNLVFRDKELTPEGEMVLKQDRPRGDPFLLVPPEGGRYRFVVQHHYRGKSVHADFRVEGEGQKYLVGWTLNDQIAGKISEPVTTLQEAKRQDKEKGAFKVDWSNGDFAQREKPGQTDTVNVNIVSERKAVEPKAWLEVEGVTEPGAVGGTKNFPGVFSIVDKGDCEYGAQKPWLHEYFCKGKALNYRIFFRRLSIEFARGAQAVVEEFLSNLEERWLTSKILQDMVLLELEKYRGEDAGTDEQSEQDFRCPERRLLEALDQFGLDAQDDLDWVELLLSGDVSKALLPFASKALVVPASEEALDTGEPSWFLIKPDDQTPYVLSDRAVEEGWIPPIGASALPKEVRDRIPREWQFWRKRQSRDVRETRDELVGKLKAGELKLPLWGETREQKSLHTQKQATTDAKFALQYQWYRGPTQVREGPSDFHYDVRLDIGGPTLWRFRLPLSPLDETEQVADFEIERDKGRLKQEGYVPPGSPLNPTKATPSYLEIIDMGPAVVAVNQPGLKKVIFQGKKLKGSWLFMKRNGEWAVEKTQDAPTVKAGA